MCEICKKSELGHEDQKLQRGAKPSRKRNDLQDIYSQTALHTTPRTRKRAISLQGTEHTFCDFTLCLNSLSIPATLTSACGDKEQSAHAASLLCHILADLQKVLYQNIKWHKLKFLIK